MALRGRTLRLPDDLWDRLEDLALERGVSVAFYIRDVLLLHVHETQKPPQRGGGRKKRGGG